MQSYTKINNSKTFFQLNKFELKYKNENFVGTENEILNVLIENAQEIIEEVTKNKKELQKKLNEKSQKSIF